MRKVVFAIRSCDQGWVSDQNGGSWSWFTAGVVRRTTLEEKLEAFQVETRDDRFLDSERQVMRNDMGSREFKTRIIEWTSDSDDEEERKWVCNLQNGDRVVIRAWAQYPGWQNQVHSVSVALYTAAIV